MSGQKIQNILLSDLRDYNPEFIGLLDYLVLLLEKKISRRIFKSFARYEG